MHWFGFNKTSNCDYSFIKTLIVLSRRFTKLFKNVCYSAFCVGSLEQNFVNFLYFLLQL